MNMERRSKARYPIELAVNYQALDPALGIAGSGRSLNMSSGGLLISSEVRLVVGTLMKVTLEWPSLLDGTTPLQLVTVGRVARSGESSFALTFEHYQFRTMGRRNGARAAAVGGSGPSITRASEHGHAEINPPDDSSSANGSKAGALRRAG
jgi:hypothetical protein